MKKTLLLTLALVFSVMAFSQGHAYLSESFDDNSWPEGWKVSEVGKDNWSISKTNKAGGEANELKFYFMPPVLFETSRVTMPAVNLKGAEKVVVSFKHYLENQIDPFSPYIIGIATSVDTINWNVGWEAEYMETGHYEVFEFISTPDMGKENVYFSLYFTGYTGALNDWSFDDIVISSQDDLDLGLVSINVPEMSNYGEHEISFSVQNIGSAAVSSFEARVTMGDIVITETFEQDIESLAIQEFTFSEAPYITPDTYSVSLEILSVNGGSDSNESNNFLEKDVAVGMGYASKIPMIEHFSSSTCGPCVSANAMMLQVENENPGKYTYTKYPVKWPGLGDPYATNECKTRVDYYEVQNAPELYLDGVSQGYSVVTPDALNAAYGTQTFADIKGAFNVVGNTITVTADFMSYITMYNVRAFISVNEKTTTGNASSNGETEFHHITMKMLESPEGNIINILAGEHQRLEFSYDMEKSFMEDINDLEVALWLQNYETKEIYNSRFAYAYTDHCYPVQNMTATMIDGCIPAFEVKWEAPEQGTPTGYKIYLDGKLLGETNAETLSYSMTEDPSYLAFNTHIAEVVAVYEDGKTSVNVVKVVKVENDVNVKENNAINCGIYPNPANDRLFIEAEAEIVEITVYDVYGRHQVTETPSHREMTSVNVSSLNTGIYFVKINTVNGETVKRFIKN